MDVNRLSDISPFSYTEDKMNFVELIWNVANSLLNLPARFCHASQSFNRNPIHAHALRLSFFSSCYDSMLLAIRPMRTRNKIRLFLLLQLRCCALTGTQAHTSCQSSTEQGDGVQNTRTLLTLSHSQAGTITAGATRWRRTATELLNPHRYYKHTGSVNDKTVGRLIYQIKFWSIAIWWIVVGLV